MGMAPFSSHLQLITLKNSIKIQCNDQTAVRKQFHDPWVIPENIVVTTHLISNSSFTPQSLSNRYHVALGHRILLVLFVSCLRLHLD